MINEKRERNIILLHKQMFVCFFSCFFFFRVTKIIQMVKCESPLSFNKPNKLVKPVIQKARIT